MKARNTNNQAGRGASVKKLVKDDKIRLIKHTVEVGEEKIEVKVACKTFGGCFLDGMQLTGDCLKCKESKMVQDLCRIETTEGKVLDFGGKKVKGNGNGEKRACNNADQNRCLIKRSEAGRNWLGHTVGSIGDKIDKLIQEGKWSKKDIESLAGTKMSKVNSHIHHLRKEKGQSVNIVAGKVQFN